MHVRPLPSLVLIGTACALLVACVAVPPASVAPPSAPVSAPSASGASPAISSNDEALPPGAVRCGVDDEPVPVGELLPRPRRLDGLDRSLLAEPPLQLPPQARALPVEVTIRASSEDLGASDDALTSLFADCGTRASVADTQALSVRVSFGSSGAPRWTAPVSAAGAPPLSSYARCVVERACRVPPVLALARKLGVLHVRTTVVAPEFLGKVEAQVVFGQPPPGMGPPRVTQAQRGKLDAIKAPVEAAALRCARALPPADDILFSFVAVLSKGRAPDVLASNLNGHAETLSRCVAEELANTFPPVSQETTVTITVQIVAQPKGTRQPRR